MSARSSGWRVLAWIDAPNTEPMPAPAPAAPPPAPAPSAIARPASCAFVTLDAANEITGWNMARMLVSMGVRLLLLCLVTVGYRATEVDRGQDGEDECLKPGDQDRLEQEDRDADRQERPRDDGVAGEYPELAAHERDQQVTGEQVGPEPDGERDQPQEVGQDLDRVHEESDPSADLRHQALDVAERAVLLDALVGEEHEHEQPEHQRERDVRVGRVDLERGPVDPEQQELLAGVARQRDVGGQGRD